MSRALWKSDAQANAEAVAKRERAYVSEHNRSKHDRAVRTIPRGLEALKRAFLREWEGELKGRMHGQGVEWETPGRIERRDGSGVTDPGGGNALGSPRWDASTRAHLFGKVNRTDKDGTYAEPMHWTVVWLERHHPLKARLLRAIGMGASFEVRCPTCSVTLPDEYSEAVVRDALGLALWHYKDAPEGTSRTI